MGNLNTKNFDLIELTRQTAGDEQFIEMCEQRIYNQIKSVVSEAINNNIRLIRIAGPSGSGKTTSAKKVVQEIKDRGIDAYYISMDNWYKTIRVSELPKTDDGEPDYESPYLLDIEAVKNDIKQLLNGEEIHLRQFDFVTRVSHISDKTINCNSTAIVVVEGLHSINPIFDSDIQSYKVYVEPSDLKLDDKNVISNSKIRLFRRLHRDYADRGMSFEDTIKKCRSVDKGQSKYIEPYIRNNTSLHRVDTLIPYEIYIHKNELPDMEELKDIPITGITKEMIPESSLLKEFYK